MIRSLCITLGFGLALINSANSQTTQAAYNVKVENVAAGKHVTSETPAVCELEVLGSDAGKRIHFQDSKEGLDGDDADRVKQRNLLLGEARTKIQQGLWELGEKYPQLRIGFNKRSRQQEITKEPQVETGPTQGVAIYLPPHKGKHELAVKLEKEEMYHMMVYIEPDGYECGSGFKLAHLYPNIGLIGQINVWAADKTLDEKLKALVRDSLEPLKKLNDKFEKKEKP